MLTPWQLGGYANALLDELLAIQVFLIELSHRSMPVDTEVKQSQSHMFESSLKWTQNGYEARLVPALGRSVLYETHDQLCLDCSEGLQS
jgi:hypothetical protein